ncbi:MAG: sulfatase [Bacteroidota bacterium]
MKINILKILFFLPVLPLVICCNNSSSTKHNAKAPNIIFILVDDMGIADLGCYGNDFHETPHIDKLAEEGIQFMNAYASSPVCSPTRASLLTGKHPASLNLTDWIPGKPSWPSEKLTAPEFRHSLPADELTIAEFLKEKGYKTASFGKWHLGGEGSLPTDHGFDVNVAGNHAGLPPSYFYPYTKDDFVLPDLNTGGTEGEFLTDRLTDEAMNWVVENKEEPFFLYLPYFTVHIWLETKPELKAKYIEKAKQGNYRSLTNPVYAGMVETLDQNVGKIMKTLELNNLLENTLVVFYSDNGGLHKDESENTPATYNGIYREGKGHLYEGGIREPLILFHKNRISEGRKSGALVTTEDIMPTLIDLCNFEVPPTEGRSFASHLLTSEPVETRPVYWHYPHYSYQGGQPSGAIREGDYKLIEFFESNAVELYNLKSDPGEETNLAAEKVALKNQLLKKLHRWQKDVNAQMPTINESYNQ